MVRSGSIFFKKTGISGTAQNRIKHVILVSLTFVDSRMKTYFPGLRIRRGDYLGGVHIIKLVSPNLILM